MPTTLRPQVGQRGLRHPQRTEHVRFELSAGLHLGHLFEHSEVTEASIVHDDIESTEMIVRLFHGGEVGLAVIHVELQRQDAVAIRLDEGCERLG